MLLVDADRVGLLEAEGGGEMLMDALSEGLGLGVAVTLFDAEPVTLALRDRELDSLMLGEADAELLVVALRDEDSEMLLDAADDRLSDGVTDAVTLMVADSEPLVLGTGVTDTQAVGEQEESQKCDSTRSAAAVEAGACSATLGTGVPDAALLVSAAAELGSRGVRASVGGVKMASPIAVRGVRAGGWVAVLADAGSIETEGVALLAPTPPSRGPTAPEAFTPSVAEAFEIGAPSASSASPLATSALV